MKDDPVMGRIKQFRLGGNLMKIDPQNRYIVLTNGLRRWSVQLNNAILFKKLEVNDVMQSCDDSKDRLKRKIMKLKKENELLRQKLKEYVEKAKISKNKQK